MQRFAQRAELGAGLRQLRRRRLEGHLGAEQLVATRAAALGVLEHPGDAAAVLALEPVDRREPFLDGVQSLGSASRPSA